AVMSWPVACTDVARSPYSVPVGRLTLLLPIACSTSVIAMPRAASALGSSWMRTAYCCAPNTCTCATPLTVEICWASDVSAYSSTVDSGSVGDDITMSMIDASAGFTLRSVGGEGRVDGNCLAAVAIADCTSCAAASMLRSSENVIVIVDKPSVDCDV